MSKPGTLTHCDEALREIEQIPEPTTRNLVNMAFVHLVKTVHLERRNLPDEDFDMRFFVSTLRDFFSEHEVIARTLEGERIGAWFEDAT